MSTDDPKSPRPFRWQALLQHSDDAVFVLDRRRRVLFVNGAWERLTGLTLDRARGLHCRRPRTVGPAEPLEDRVAHALTPPPEALQGQLTRTRRLIHLASSPPGRVTEPCWWDVEFLPFRTSHEGQPAGALLLGRVLPYSAPRQTGSMLIPERLVALRQRAVQRYSLDLLHSVHPEMVRLTQQVRLAARSDGPVLLTGERGVGKRTVARVIHALSARSERPLAVLDCALLPGDALDRVLSEPSVATVYLARPESLSRERQARLAEVLDCGDGPRLLLGCGPAPAEAARAGRLLDALFWATSALILDVPPLRQRREDLPLLTDALLALLKQDESGKRITGVSSAAREVLRGHAWPGNLRELRSVLTLARDHATGEVIEVGDLPASVRLLHRLSQEPGRSPTKTLPLEEVMAEVERRLIRLALARVGGHRGKAAELLGIYRPRLLRRIEALGLGDASEPAEAE